MKDPYEVLGLPSEAGEAAIRKRYLELVRQHPPDQAPARFAEVHAAYDALRDPVKRLETKLFELHGDDTLDDIIAEVQRRMRGARIPVETLLSLGED
jgi:curved DNA-binding protein CbpA